MKRLLMVVTTLVFVFVAASAFADSSGNFTATGTSASCTTQPATFDSSTGDFTGATLTGSTAIMSFTTNIQTPNGQGTTLLIRPSLDTGLFTATKLSTTVNNATADVGIMVCVYVDPTPNSPGLTVLPTNCVVYDQRIQQVSNTLFANLATCVNTTVCTACCTTNADCASGDICSNPTGVAGAGSCQGPAPGCNFEILLTTLSAHSFDFVVPMPGNGSHRVVMTWAEIGTNNNTVGGSTLSCVGPVTLTVQQVKNFKNDTPISFFSN